MLAPYLRPFAAGLGTVALAVCLIAWLANGLAPTLGKASLLFGGLMLCEMGYEPYYRHWVIERGQRSLVFRFGFIAARLAISLPIIILGYAAYLLVALFWIAITQSDNSGTKQAENQAYETAMADYLIGATYWPPDPR